MYDLTPSESFPDTCERCGRPENRTLIIGNPYQKTCECSRAFNAAKDAIRHVDPERFMLFDNLDSPNETVLAAKARLLEIASGQRNKGVFMLGNPGGGKTHLAIATARMLLERGVLCGAFSLAGLISRIQSTYGYDDAAETKAGIIESVVSHDAVVLDDIGKEHTSPDVESIVYQLVDGLYGARKTVIASSNLSGKQITERYDAAVLSRLGGLCEKLPVKGEDRRAKAWEF